MATTKEQALEIIRRLPDDCTLEEIQARLHFCAKVEKGIRAVNEGRVVSQEEAEARVKTWLK